MKNNKLASSFASSNTDNKSANSAIPTPTIKPSSFVKPILKDSDSNKQ